LRIVCQLQSKSKGEIVRDGHLEEVREAAGSVKPGVKRSEPQDCGN